VTRRPESSTDDPPRRAVGVRAAPRWRSWLARVRWRRRHADAGALVVSYPKCGRTWLRVLLGKALCEQFGLDERQLLATRELTRAAQLIPTRFVHDGTGGVAGIPWTEQDPDRSQYRDKRVALLIRDPRDVVVSSYFQATRRMQVYRGSLSEFIRDDCFGVRTVLAMYGAWEASRDVPQRFLLLRYEDLHRDASGCLRSLLALIGLDRPDEAALAAAVAYARFDNMRRLEESGSLDRKLRPGVAGDAESYKVRRGVIGGYAAYLSPDDIAYLEQSMASAGDPFGYAGRR